MEEIELYGYCDESGNTGLNVFDEKQPYFWLATLLSRYNLEVTAKIDINKLANSVGEKELHGNEMGLTKINQIAVEIIKILEKNNCYIVISRVEKRHIVRLKLFDYLFDNATNKAVTALHYEVRALRLQLADIFCDNVTLQMEMEFWNLYNNPNEQDLKNILKELILKIENNVSDKRAKELIIDALSWAYQHPLEVFDVRKNMFDSPNIIAFSQLLTSINSIYKGKKVSIKKFFHDEQNEFGKSLKEMFDYIKNVRTEFKPTDLITDIEITDNYKCILEITSSNSCCGVQLTDILLCLVKKHFHNPTLLKGSCKKLIDYIIPRTFITELTDKAQKKEIIKINRELFERPLTKKDEYIARENMKKIEESRKIRFGKI